MNILPFEKQITAVSALTEGCSIRATERLTGIHRDTIMRLGARVGRGCVNIHDELMRDLNVARIELDEAWSFVGKKQRNAKRGETKAGDQYVFIALDGTGKAILSWRVGKRNRQNTYTFLADLRARVLNAPEISSDAFKIYPEAIEEAFGADCRYGRIEKHYRAEPAKDAARRYSPGYVVSVSKREIMGRPERISTSYVERQNLTLRMHQKRFARLSNGFSKKLENHKAAVGLYVGHYNFCRVHGATRITPAMALGVTDHIWTVGELIESATIH